MLQIERLTKEPSTRCHIQEKDIFSFYFAVFSGYFFSQELEANIERENYTTGATFATARKTNLNSTYLEDFVNNVAVRHCQYGEKSVWWICEDETMMIMFVEIRAKDQSSNARHSFLDALPPHLRRSGKDYSFQYLFVQYWELGYVQHAYNLTCLQNSTEEILNLRIIECSTYISTRLGYTLYPQKFWEMSDVPDQEAKESEILRFLEAFQARGRFLESESRHKGYTRNEKFFKIEVPKALELLTGGAIDDLFYKTC